MRNSRRRGRFSKQATATKYDVVSDAQRKRWEANVVLSQHNYSTTASEDDKTDSGVLLDLADDTSNVRDAPILATAQEEIVSIICEIYLLLMTFINYRHSLSHWSICVSYTRSTARTCKSKQLIIYINHFLEQYIFIKKTVSNMSKYFFHSRQNQIKQNF